MPEFSGQDVRRIGRAVRGYEHDQRFTASDRPPPGVAQPQVEFVRVTSTTTTAGRYPGKVVLFDAGPGTDTDLGDCWVVDANGGTLAVQKYQARRVNDANGRPVFRVEWGAPGIEAKEADGSPDYTGITVLVVDQATGGSLSQPGAGQAQISFLAASATQIGNVNLVDQTLGAGTKKVDKLKVGTTASLPAGVDIFAPGSNWLSDTGHQTNVGDSAGVNGAGGITAGSFGLFHFISTSGSGGGSHDLHMFLDSSTRKLALTSTTDSTQPLYSCRGSDGISATITLAKITAGGANGSITFTGGIATAKVDPT